MADFPSSPQHLQVFYDRVIDSHKDLTILFSNIANVSSDVKIPDQDLPNFFRCLAEREKAMRSHWIVMRDVMVNGWPAALMTENSTIIDEPEKSKKQKQSKTPKAAQKEGPSKMIKEPTPAIAKNEKKGNSSMQSTGARSVSKNGNKVKAVEGEARKQMASKGKKVLQDTNKQAEQQRLRAEDRPSKKARQRANRMARDAANQVKQKVLANKTVQAIPEAIIQADLSRSTEMVGDVIIKQEPLESWEF